MAMKKSAIFFFLTFLLLLFVKDNAIAASAYWAKVSTAVNPSVGTAYVGESSSVPEETEASSRGSDSEAKTKGHMVTFYLKATCTNSSYHFKNWTCSGQGTYSIASSTSASTSVSVQTNTSSAGETNAFKYTATANFLPNYYYINVTAQSGGNGTVGIDSGQKYTTSKGGSVSFNLTKTPNSGYHFKEWQCSGGSVTNDVFTANASNSYDTDGAVSYTVTGVFGKDYAAKINTSVSTAGTGTASGSAQVKYGSGSYASSATTTTTTASTDVTFNIKATANKGYKFLGWSTADGSIDYFSTTSETTYGIKTSGTEGGTNTKNLFAVFDKGSYTIHFLSDSKDTRPVSGTMPDQNFTSGIAQKINKHTFVCNGTVNYDAQGGTCEKASDTKDRFKCWTEWRKNESGTWYAAVTYNEEEEINRMETHGSTISLTATWKGTISVTLPSVTYTDIYGIERTFEGWYSSATGGSKKGDIGANVELNPGTVYAHWKGGDITINANASDYTVGDRVIFKIKRNNVLVTSIAVPVGESVTLKNMADGEYTVTPDSWSWSYTSSPATLTQTVTNSAVNFNFTLTPKSNTKKHSEQQNVNTF